MYDIIKEEAVTVIIGIVIFTPLTLLRIKIGTTLDEKKTERDNGIGLLLGFSLAHIISAIYQIITL